MSNRVDGLVSDGSNFQWACRPILNWMHFLGIPLEISNDPKKYFIYIYAFLLFFLTLESNFVSIGLYMATNSKPFQSAIRDESHTYVLNDKIQKITQISTNCIVHLGLLFSTSSNWPALVKILKHLEENNNVLLGRKEYKRFRTIFIIGLSVIILASSKISFKNYDILLNSFCLTGSYFAGSNRYHSNNDVISFGFMDENSFHSNIYFVILPLQHSIVVYLLCFYGDQFVPNFCCPSRWKKEKPNWAMEALLLVIKWTHRSDQQLFWFCFTGADHFKFHSNN